MNVPIVTRIDRETGLYHWSDGAKLPSVTHILKSVDPHIGEWAREEHLTRGRIVHKVCALLAGGYDGSGLDLASVDPQYHDYGHGWMSFLCESGFQPLRIEAPVRSKQGYSGIPDCIGTFPGRRGPILTILDMKTSQIPEDWWAIQLAAYRQADEETFGAHIEERRSLILRPAGTYTLLPAWRNTSDWSQWLSILNTYRWLQRKEAT